MNTLSQLIYQVPRDPGGQFGLVASSLPPAETASWRRTIDPLLRAGDPPARYYQNLGSQAALIRWTAAARQPAAGDMAHVFIGDAAQLTDGRALQLPELPAELLFPRGKGPLPPIPETALGTAAERDVLDAQARSPEVAKMVIPLVSWILRGNEKIVMASGMQPAAPEAVLWALIGILAALGDSRPVSFLTRATRVPDTPPGLFVCFRPQPGQLAPAAGYERAAAGLVGSYVQAGPTGLYQFLRKQGVLESAGHAAKVARLLALWPDAQQPAQSGARTAPGGDGHDTGHQQRTSTAPPPAAVMTMPPPRPAATAAERGNGQAVTCPICLAQLDWGALPLRKWDGVSAYEGLDIPDGATDAQRAFLERGAYVQCNGQSGLSQGMAHYLPVDYGRFGPPVVLGFVGLTHSGKSHLLTAMVGMMNRLRDYGIDSRPVDLALHRRFRDEAVDPLFRQRKALQVTDRGVVAFVDAFIITPPGGGKARPVALFDVAGAELAREAGEKRFLDVADGFFFVVDPEQLGDDGLGDDTFTAVLNVVGSTPGRLPDKVCAAIVLNKADLVRFDHPVTRWLRTDVPALDPAEFRAESADVYAYLRERGAAEWTRPYDACTKATLHVASPTGGAAVRTANGEVIYPRGVRPRRVLRPLVAMLAMTGVLTGEEAENVGTLCRWHTAGAALHPPVRVPLAAQRRLLAGRFVDAIRRYPVVVRPDPPLGTAHG